MWWPESLLHSGRFIQADACAKQSSTAGSDSPANLDPVHAEDDFNIRASTISLENIHLDTEVAVEAFKIFASSFRPQLPIIGSISVDAMLHGQPLLFWTIIIIIGSHRPEARFVDMNMRFKDPFTRYLNQQIMDAPLPLYKIQALVLLCEWPFGVETQAKDPTWLYSGVAIQAARFMSLDRQQTVPSLRSLGVAPGNISARINTWLGCFLVTTSLSYHLGLPAPIDSELDLQTIEEFLQLHNVPTLFSSRVRIQLVVAKFSALLNRNTGESTTVSLIRLVDVELSALQPQGMLHGEKETRIELDILDAKLHIYALFFAKASEGTSRHIMLANALSAAQRFIHLATLSWRTTDGGFVTAAAAQRERCLPKNHYRGFAFATIILLKFFYGQQDVAYEERQGAARHIALAQDHFRGCSIDLEDEYSRTAKVFEALAQTSDGETGDRKPRLTHRMGASIVYDAVTNASEVRGTEVGIQEEKILEPPPNEMQATAALNDGQALDLTQMAPSHFGMNPDLLDGFWNDPFMSMVNFDASDMHSF
ncbi:uncharacterized protein F5Z01DRAFT_680787 [Emericellopsis atlantica]|uniref:Xylanolytic transcriptional activator regulatory domain-containing protein n=1 Tax=Emericellopsis atlantica TaxID=2614577 RepID=A0A9P7ZPJ5_9HYPO|nr:uncharacterized protein F5Z01DRAFT_680787 [Emericellopsis atlantica]KAG9255820.1 hypothetical protein F5Z01DRAFT_680787 [Emericellopsis atlantica]